MAVNVSDKPLNTGLLVNTLLLLRPHQWIKNGFVFAAPLFAKELDEPGPLTAAVLTFFAFCFISSAVYVLNDIADIDRDRAHPAKRRRPLASGALNVPYALWVLAVLVVTSLAMAFVLVSWETGVVLLLYGLANVLYSYVLKYMVILDVAFIAVGFILRIAAGAVATETIPSYWLILCTLNVSLFLGFAKRRAEVIALGDDKHKHREVLAHYSEGFLDQMISVVTTTTLLCYILYTVDPRTMEYFGTRALVLTVPFVMYGIFRYLYLTYHLENGGSPTRAILMDPLFLINNALWGLACIAIIYWGEYFPYWMQLRDG